AEAGKAALPTAAAEVVPPTAAGARRSRAASVHRPAARTSDRPRRPAPEGPNRPGDHRRRRASSGDGSPRAPRLHAYHGGWYRRSSGTTASPRM
ncbi:MAG: hypothetical protein AVDCRST_MAG50-2850, partial [uncultured Acidimicrobiales bacterium]